jgi:Tol biopolymer transport system component
MRLTAVFSAALSALILVSPSSRLAAQASSSPIRKVAELDTTDVWGIAEPASGRFVVFGSTRGIKVLDRRTRAVAPIIDSAVAVTPSWFGGSVSLSASGQRLIFFGADETRRKPFVWSVDLDTMTGKPVSAPHRVSLVPASEASISDDGQWIALVAGTDAQPGTPPIRKLLIIPSAGGDERMLDSAPRIERPRWTPDGKSIYYIRGRGNGPALARISASGGQPDSLAPAAGLIGVSPDGRRVAYYPQGIGDPVAVIVADMQGRRIGRSKMLDNDLYRIWSRSQPGTLLGSRDFEPKTLETVSLDNGKISPFPVNDPFVVAPQFSPNGRLVAAPSTVDDRWQIVVIDAAAKRRRVLRTDVEPEQGSIQWSPDGSHIAFLALDTSLTLHDLYTVDVATGHAARLAGVGPARWSNRGLFRWRSDARSIDYVTGTVMHAGGAPTLERVTLSGEQTVVRKLPVVPQGVGTDGGYRLLNDSLIAIGRNYSKVPTDSQYLAIINTRTGATRAFVNQFAFWNMRSNANALSPDGKWVAFGSGGEKDGKMHPQWTITSDDGKTVRPLGEPMPCNAWPEQWLPDSRAFLAGGIACGGRYHIEHYLVPIDGSPVRHLTVPDDYGITLTPDGRGLLVSALGLRSMSLIALDVNKAIGGDAVQAGSARKPGKN